MRIKRYFFRQKLTLYFDEHVPTQVVAHFRSSYWQKKIRVLWAPEEGMKGRGDKDHYRRCGCNGHTLVTMDMDFNNDQEYPFTFGAMAGIIILQASPSEAARAIDLLRKVLDFLLRLPRPKGFLMETKFISQRNGAVMRGRDARTKEVKEMQIIADRTTLNEVRRFFNW